MPPVSVVVEGPSDVAVVTRILGEVGCTVANVYGQTGCDFIDTNITGYNNAARFSPWFVLRDLDNAACAAQLAASLLPTPARWMRFRIAVRELEAWLLGDGKALSGYLRVSAAVIPTDPEGLDDPKQTLVDIARRSTNSAIRDDMVPDHGVSAVVGPGYVGRISEFALKHWRPEVARTQCPSLDKCLTRVADFAAF